MDREGLYAEGARWDSVKVSVSDAAAGIGTYDEAHELVKDALKVAGGKHSFLKSNLSCINQDDAAKAIPTVSITEDSILTVNIPSTMGLPDTEHEQYISSALDAFKTYSHAKGIIVDLRNNRGGDFFSMIASLSPLLPDGRVLSFKGRKNVFISPVSLNWILKCEGLSRKKRLKITGKPVAVLVDGITASAAEATVLAFKGMDSVKIFGTPTAAYTSYNIDVNLSDGYEMVLTIGNYTARNGECYCNDPIIPDFETGNPIIESLSWIRGHQQN